MQVRILASGSKGNAVFVEMDGTRLLLDAGISATKIKKGLASLGVEASSLDGILVTHEHRDHVAGLVTLSKWYHLPIFTRPGTIEHMKERAAIPAECFCPVGEHFSINGLSVDSFNIPHDAAEPVGFCLRGRRTVTLATDLGFVTANVQAALEGADVLILESNHDPEVLKQGAYPWHLKRRILSNRGHLANSDAAWALLRMQKRPEKVFLAHLSEENNRPDLAEDTVQGILARQGVNIDLTVASQNEMVGWYLN
ncbi:Phosphoribosyl 1,2-cyclic phosphodiesterase [Selenomonas ruminantium]|uniref:Phosphoribosyl 1,2-cyclic phosphodiesterase n=1 Tax=Selenomonas ruminantium TaxID=971 RepID=A0A1M6TDQ3_SELRU|nr:MBL fold metallo-hydrolase [Selenomonas ruminantium]SHK55019.1 Phosphoribosyl 1,2-cyclic phosphodiesterase [Selenomonas ruminantium]